MSEHYTSVPSSGLNDVNSDAWHLHDLLEVTSTMLIEQGTFVKADGKRDIALDQVSSLLWIARDLAETTAKNIDALFHKPTEPTPAK